MIVAPWGEEKTGKTTLALSFPKPLFHFDIDVGGYKRAAWRVDTDGVTSETFAQPIQVEQMMGQGVTDNAGKLTIRFPKKVVGVRELWQAIITRYVEVLQDPQWETIVFDSFTQLWNICHRAHLQEVQEKQIASSPKIDDNALRESLMPKEYGPPNDKMRAVIYNARSTGKHLVLTHYPKDVYGVRVGEKGQEEYRTGEQTLDGFKEVMKIGDLALKTTIKTIRVDDDNRRVPVATITKCGLEGLGIAVEGMELPSADYAGLEALQGLFS